MGSGKGFLCWTTVKLQMKTSLHSVCSLREVCSDPFKKKKKFLYWGLSSKESTCNAGDVGLTSGLGRFPGKGNGN